MAMYITKPQSIRRPENENFKNEINVVSYTVIKFKREKVEKIKGKILSVQFSLDFGVLIKFKLNISPSEPDYIFKVSYSRLGVEKISIKRC